MSAALLAWSERTRRDLPWRRTRDPWAVLVSETMLAQTQVARVVEPFVAFVGRWPSPAGLAAATPGQVIEAWQGLGYNQRAVRLHACSGAIVERHGGCVPDDQAALVALPGVGAYTARAVLAFAFERPVGVVDTNAARVLARAFAGRRLSGREVQAVADALVPDGRGWEWNTAMLDLGATVCTASAPACSACPLAVGGVCRWFATGRRDPDPVLGTAGVSGHQSRFAGSDRQGRGRLVRALTRQPVPPDEIAAVTGWSDDPERAARVALTLVRDGLAVSDVEGNLALPGG